MYITGHGHEEGYVQAHGGSQIRMDDILAEANKTIHTPSEFLVLLDTCFSVCIGKKLLEFAEKTKSIHRWVCIGGTQNTYGYQLHTVGGVFTESLSRIFHAHTYTTWEELCHQITSDMWDIADGKSDRQRCFCGIYAPPNMYETVFSKQSCIKYLPSWSSIECGSSRLITDY
jgi:hypothetical protein